MCSTAHISEDCETVNARKEHCLRSEVHNDINFAPLWEINDRNVEIIEFLEIVNFVRLTSLSFLGESVDPIWLSHTSRFLFFFLSYKTSLNYS